MESEGDSTVDAAEAVHHEDDEHSGLYERPEPGGGEHLFLADARDLGHSVENVSGQCRGVVLSCS